ncbi:hypothetical protein, partial [Pedobacter sp. JCM 36344]|uniref:hypothetical protein n=1 Tax=Pedobacter sp. JCM 36344 TaxID=3374280 RepID=UPI00397989B6
SYTVKSKSITGSIFKDNTPSKSVEINVGLDEKRTGLNFFFSLGWSINSDWSIEKRRKDFKYCPILPEIS